MIKKRRRKGAKPKQAVSLEGIVTSEANPSAVNELISTIQSEKKKPSLLGQKHTNSTQRNVVVDGVKANKSSELSEQKGGAFAEAESEGVGMEAQKSVTKWGPMKAPAFLRSSVVVDYQPDICKDYRETGTCGYGDSCIYMHTREMYKAGWELDRDEKRKKEGEEEAAKKKDPFPHACFICRQPFTAPVVTKCKHYFCLACAFSRYKTHSACAVCKENTQGIFNEATELKAWLKEQE